MRCKGCAAERKVGRSMSHELRGITSSMGSIALSMMRSTCVRIVAHQKRQLEIHRPMLWIVEHRLQMGINSASTRLRVLVCVHHVVWLLDGSAPFSMPLPAHRATLLSNWRAHVTNVHTTRTTSRSASWHSSLLNAQRYLQIKCSGQTSAAATWHCPVTGCCFSRSEPGHMRSMCKQKEGGNNEIYTAGPCRAVGNADPPDNPPSAPPVSRLHALLSRPCSTNLRRSARWRCPLNPAAPTGRRSPLPH